jgi:hypothetical protein
MTTENSGFFPGLLIGDIRLSEDSVCQRLL